MTNEENNNIQEQENPDFELAAELLREGAHRYEQIAALGNVAMHIRFLTDAIMELTEEVRETKKAIYDSERDSVWGAIDRIGDQIHDVCNEDIFDSVHVQLTDGLIHPY